ncbi:MAG: hypothetical protein ACOY3F_08065 [Bacillota bacterium]
MARCRTEVVRETCLPVGQEGWKYCLQWCRWHHEDDYYEEGYRDIYRDDKGRLRPHRAQARIPNLALLQELINRAKAEGWGELSGWY